MITLEEIDKRLEGICNDCIYYRTIDMPEIRECIHPDGITNILKSVSVHYLRGSTNKDDDLYVVMCSKKEDQLDG